MLLLSFAEIEKAPVIGKIELILLKSPINCEIESILSFRRFISPYSKDSAVGEIELILFMHLHLVI